MIQQLLFYAIVIICGAVSTFTIRAIAKNWVSLISLIRLSAARKACSISGRYRYFLGIVSGLVVTYFFHARFFFLEFKNHCRLCLPWEWAEQPTLYGVLSMTWWRWKLFQSLWGRWLFQSWLYYLASEQICSAMPLSIFFFLFLDIIHCKRPQLYRRLRRPCGKYLLRNIFMVGILVARFKNILFPHIGKYVWVPVLQFAQGIHLHGRCRFAHAWIFISIHRYNEIAWFLFFDAAVWLVLLASLPVFELIFITTIRLKKRHAMVERQPRSFFVTTTGGRVHRWQIDILSAMITAVIVGIVCELNSLDLWLKIALPILVIGGYLIFAKILMRWEVKRK